MAGHPKFSFRQQASVRDHIDAVKLVNFLQDHAVKGRGKKVTSSRVTAALGLLKKCLPDLQQTALTDAEGGPVKAIAIVTDNPVEAARAYQEIIKGG